MTRLRGIDYEAGMALFEADGHFVVVDTNKKDVVQVETELTAVTAGGWLKVAGVQKRVETMLTMTGAHGVLDIHPDASSAIKSFGA